MKSLDIPPARHEVEDQLERMLGAARFRAAKKAAQFLGLSVTRALAGKKTTGLILARAIFGAGYNQIESDDVRVLAHKLRDLIEKYNGREGATDVVTISFPKPQNDKSVRPVRGEAYTPLFSYNPKHPAYIHLRLGFRFLEQGTYRDYVRAFNIFAGILDDDRDNLGAALGLIETMCKFADRQWDVPHGLHPFRASEILIEQFSERGEKYWRFWAVKAYLSQGREKGNNDEARRSYAKALKLDSMATAGYLPYIEFLLLVNETEKALGLAQRYVNGRVEDSTAVAQYGQLLLIAGRHEHGTGHLKAALELDPNNRLAHDTLATFFLIQNNPTEAAFHLRRLQDLCDSESFTHIVEFLTRIRGSVTVKTNVEKLLSDESIAAV